MAEILRANDPSDERMRKREYSDRGSHFFHTPKAGEPVKDLATV
ncbi:MAG: hypothetical protein ACJ746_13285 [Bryobacteraceae bacterium]